MEGAQVVLLVTRFGLAWGLLGRAGCARHRRYTEYAGHRRHTGAWECMGCSVAHPARQMKAHTPVYSPHSNPSDVKGML